MVAAYRALLGTPTLKGGHAMAAPLSATLSASCAAQSSGGSYFPYSYSAWPGQVVVRVSCCCAAIRFYSGEPTITFDRIGAGPR